MGRLSTFLKALMLSDVVSDTTIYETARLIPSEAGESEVKAPTPEPSLLLNMPNEILLLIGDALDLKCGICFSLTCKKLHWLVTRPQGADLGESRGNFLRLLEKDEGDRFVYCCFCNGMHYFPLRQNLICSGADSKNLQSGPAYSRSYDITFTQVRGIMNRHFYGGELGLPLSHADLNAVAGTPETEPYHSMRPEWSRDRSARIIDGELYLCVTHTLSQKIRNDYGNWSDKKMREKVDEGFNVCVHVYACGERRTGRLARRITSLDKALGPTPEPFVPCSGTVGSCDACFTDYDLTIEKSTRSTRWVVTVRGYHRVGAGRDTTDLAWTCGGPNRLLEGYGGRSFSGEYKSDKKRPTRKDVGVPRGDVRRTWMQDVAGYPKDFA